MTAVLRAEWTKFRTVRSTPLTLLLAVALAVGFGMLISRGFGIEYASAAPADRAGFDPTHSSLVGCFVLAQLAVGALGVLAFTSEYATGLIGPTLAAVPRRGRLLAAKTAVVGATAVVAGLVAVAGAFLAGQPVLRATGAPSAALGDPHVLRALGGGALWLAAVALYGLAFGVLLRSAAGAFAVLVGTTLVAQLVAGALPGWFTTWWPPIAGQQVFHTVEVEGLGPWAGLGVMYAGAAAVLAAAYVVFRTRDA